MGEKRLEKHRERTRLGRPQADEVPHRLHEKRAAGVLRDVVRDVRVVRLHERDLVLLREPGRGPDERAGGGAVDQVWRVRSEGRSIQKMFIGQLKWDAIKC